jgi:hypothetical protein
MQTYGEVEAELYSFLSSGLQGDEWSASHLINCIPVVKRPTKLLTKTISDPELLWMLFSTEKYFEVNQCMCGKIFKEKCVKFYILTVCLSSRSYKKPGTFYYALLKHFNLNRWKRVKLNLLGLEGVSVLKEILKINWLWACPQFILQNCIHY